MADIHQTIDKNLWIFIEAFAGCRKPINSSEVQVLIDKCNIKGIISLLDDSENLDMYAGIGIPYLHVPVRGGTAPSEEQVNSALNFQREVDGLVVVHCMNGRRRTGTMLSAIFIMLNKLNESNAESLYEEVISRLKDKKPDCDLREEQLLYLQNLCGISHKIL